ncbi:MAG: LysR family transcriptional regulator [Clostridia bacterium]|nr:LysR family transcriptional regulator [Clostridia bacterium]
MDLKYLHTFHTVVREGSFTKAAEKLNYTQSTITFQIGQLEQELSVRLFEKIGRRMVLTKAGERLLPLAEEVLGAVEKLRYEEQPLEECTETLEVGVGETLLCYFMPAVVKEFHRRAPKARLLLRSMNCYDIRNALLEGTLDLGVFYEDVGGFGGKLRVYPLGECPLVTVASPATQERCPELCTPDRVWPVPFLINEKNCIFRRIFEAFLAEKSIILDHILELWSIPTIKNLVQNDLGITFLPEFAVRQELKSGALQEIPTGLESPAIHAVCAHHQNKWISPLMRLFIELTQDTYFFTPPEQ